MEIKRKPTSPGEILSKEFLKPMKLGQKELADHIGCDIKVISCIINERTSITAEMAIKLGSAFDTSADFWLNAQMAVDLHEAAQSVKKRPGRISRRAR